MGSDAHPWISDPRLREIAQRLENTGQAAQLLDQDWRLVWVSKELKTLLGEADEQALGYGMHAAESLQKAPWRTAVTEETFMKAMSESLPWAAHDLPRGVEGLRDLVNGELAPLLENVRPAPAPAMWTSRLDFVQGDLPPLRVLCHNVRLHNESGERLGCLQLFNAGLPAHLLALMIRGDERMFERMARIREPARRATAVMFADLGASGTLSRRLPTAAYFRLIRDITSAIDDVVIEHGGIVGHHVGDGITAFFLSEDSGSDSGAARSAIQTGLTLSAVAGEVAAEMYGEGVPIEPDDCRLNIGLHWGSGLFMGQVVTGGRLEVTALGDEVNECARIEECARDGQVLASKAIVERLSATDATALGVDPRRLAYRSIAELPHAGDKARRDAGAVAVTELKAAISVR